MRAAILAEHRKLVSTRLWWILLLAMAAYLAFIGAVLAFSLTVAAGSSETSAGSPTAGAALGGSEAAASVYSVVNSVGYVFPLVIGTLAVTTEFRHRTVTASLLVEPSRTRFVIAKVVVTFVAGLLYGLVGTAATVVVAAPLLGWRGDGAFLGDAEVLLGLGLGVLVVGLWAVIGVGFGTVLTNQVAAIVVVLAFTQFVEPVARASLGAFDATDDVARFLPGGAADAVIGSSLFSQFGSDAALLSRPSGLAVLLAYAVGLALLGRLTTLRRDVG